MLWTISASPDVAAKAQDAVAELQEAGIVRQVSAGKGNRLYEVREVFALLGEFEAHPATFRIRG